MSHRYFVLHQGYVEDQSIACVTLSHDVGFETPEEAMESWYQFLLGLAGEKVEKLRSCCQESGGFSSKRFDTFRFCCFCGKNLAEVPTAEDVAHNLWKDLWNGTHDSLGRAFFEKAEEAGWGFGWPGGEFIRVYRMDHWVNRWDGVCESNLVWSEG